MSETKPIRASQRIVQVCLLLFAAIGMFGGVLQMVLGQPETTPRLDNVHRFLAGIYLGTSFICLWAAITIRKQDALIYLIGLGVLMAGLGRIVSIMQVGIPEPKMLWLGYLAPELAVSSFMLVVHAVSQRTR